MAHIVAGEHGFAGELATTGHGANPSAKIAWKPEVLFKTLRKSLATGGGDIRGWVFRVKAPPQTSAKVVIDETRK